MNPRSIPLDWDSSFENPQQNESAGCCPEAPYQLTDFLDSIRKAEKLFDESLAHGPHAQPQKNPGKGHEINQRQQWRSLHAPQEGQSAQFG